MKLHVAGLKLEPARSLRIKKAFGIPLNHGYAREMDQADALLVRWTGNEDETAFKIKTALNNRLKIYEVLEEAGKPTRFIRRIPTEQL